MSEENKITETEAIDKNNIDELKPIAMSDGKLIAEKDIVLDEKGKIKSKAKSIFLKILFIVFNIAAILFVVLLENSQDDKIMSGKEIGNVIGKNFVFFAIALLMYAIHVLTDTICYYSLIKHAGYNGAGRKRLTLKVSILGKYYDNITPWNTGGQPFQMAYMNKYGIDGATACSTPLIKFTIRIFSVNIVLFFLFIFATVQLSGFVRFFAYFGILFSSILPVTLVVFSKNIKGLVKITEKLIKVLFKMKIVKDYDKQLEKSKELIDNFMAAFKFVASSKKTIAIISILQIINSISISSIPYFIIRAFGVTNINFFDTLTLCYFVTYGASFFPTPGASGASEITFYAVFAQTLGGGYLFWGILIWRALIFYLPIFMGLMVYLFDWLVGTKKIEAVKNLKWLSSKTIFKKSKE